MRRARRTWYQGRNVSVSLKDCASTREGSHRQAATTDLDVKRHGRGANLVAITGFVPVDFMNSPRNPSELPKPYTCHSDPHKQCDYCRIKVLLRHQAALYLYLVNYISLTDGSQMPLVRDGLTSAVSTNVMPSSTSVLYAPKLSSFW